MHGTLSGNSHGSATQGSWSQHGNHQHGVQFYSQDKFLLEELGGYIGGALHAGDAAVVVATEAHRNGLLQWVTAQGLDLTDLLVKGRFIALDARQTLAAFMVEGWPNEELFNKVIGEVVTKASAAAGHERPRVAIFGEMVA